MGNGAPLSTVYILLVDFVIGLVLDVFASSIGELSLKNLDFSRQRKPFLFW